MVEIITAATPTPIRPGCPTRALAARAQIRHFMKNARRTRVGHVRRAPVNQALRSPHGSPSGRSPASLGPSGDRWRAPQEGGLLRPRARQAPAGHRRAASPRRRTSVRSPDVVKPAGGAIGIRGSEGVAVAARALPSHPGPDHRHLRKGQGLEVHTHDRPNVARVSCGDRGRWVDVEWGHMVDDRLFDVGIRGSANAAACWRGWRVRSPRRTATSRASGMDGGQGEYTALNFTVQARPYAPGRVMRGVRRVQEVVRIGRVKGRRPASAEDPAVRRRC